MFPSKSLAGRSIAATVAAVALTTVLVADTAKAGEYHVYSCRTPDGGVAPTDGWSPATFGVSALAENKCAKDGSLFAALGEGASHVVGNDIATWTLNVPTTAVLTKASLWRAGDAEGGAATNATYEFWLAGPTQENAFDSCVYVSGVWES
jgi:hypothetical protein